MFVCVGMRTEAKPCSLGRSGSAYPNARRSRHPRWNPRLHVLITSPPRGDLSWLFVLPARERAAKVPELLSALVPTTPQKPFARHGSTPPWCRLPIRRPAPCFSWDHSAGSRAAVVGNVLRGGSPN